MLTRYCVWSSRGVPHPEHPDVRVVAASEGAGGVQHDLLVGRVTGQLVADAVGVEELEAEVGLVVLRLGRQPGLPGLGPLPPRRIVLCARRSANTLRGRSRQSSRPRPPSARSRRGSSVPGRPVGRARRRWRVAAVRCTRAHGSEAETAGTGVGTTAADGTGLLQLASAARTSPTPAVVALIDMSFPEASTRHCRTQVSSGVIRTTACRAVLPRSSRTRCLRRRRRAGGGHRRRCVSVRPSGPRPNAPCRTTLRPSYGVDLDDVTEPELERRHGVLRPRCQVRLRRSAAVHRRRPRRGDRPARVRNLIPRDRLHQRGPSSAGACSPATTICVRTNGRRFALVTIVDVSEQAVEFGVTVWDPPVPS